MKLYVCAPLSSIYINRRAYPSLSHPEGFKVVRRPVLAKLDMWPSWPILRFSQAVGYPCKESATDVSSSSRDAGNVLSDILLHDFACGKMSAVKDPQFIEPHFL